MSKPFLKQDRQRLAVESLASSYSERLQAAERAIVDLLERVQKLEGRADANPSSEIKFPKLEL